MYVCLCNGINIDPTVKLADNRAGPKERQREKAKEDEDEDEARVLPIPNPLPLPVLYFGPWH